MIRWWVLPLVAALLWAVVPPGSAWGQDRAAVLTRRGERFFVQGMYEQASEAFREAFERSGRPGPLRYLAECFVRLGRLEEARLALADYLALASRGERPSVTRRIEALDARIAEGQQMESAPETETRAASPAGVAREEAGADRTGPLVLFTAAAVALVSALPLAIISQVANGRAEDQCRSGLCPAAAASDIDQAKAFGLAADLSGLVAVGLGVSGLVWWFAQHDDGNGSEAHSSVQPVVLLDGQGVAAGLHGCF